MASLSPAERRAYIPTSYYSDQNLESVRRWAIVYALQKLCPKYDLDKVMTDVNQLLPR